MGSSSLNVFVIFFLFPYNNYGGEFEFRFFSWTADHNAYQPIKKKLQWRSKIDSLLYNCKSTSIGLGKVLGKY